MMRGVASPTVEQVVDVIVRLLAEERGESEADVRAWRRAAGRCRSTPYVSSRS
jgi:hypothetical protein